MKRLSQTSYLNSGEKMNKKYLNGLYQAKSTSILKLDEFDSMKQLNRKEFF